MQPPVILHRVRRKHALEPRHRKGRPEEITDINFLRFFFFFEIPHLDDTNQDMLGRDGLLLSFMLVQGEHSRFSSSKPPLIQEVNTIEQNKMSELF